MRIEGAGPLFSRRGGPGVVLEGGVTPCPDWLGGSRTGVPSGVVWLAAGQVGVRGVEARRSRRSFGPPDSYMNGSCLGFCNRKSIAVP